MFFFVLKSIWNVYGCERDRTNRVILNFSTTIDLLEKIRTRSSAEFLEEELRSRLLSERLNVTEKFGSQALLSTVVLHALKGTYLFDGFKKSIFFTHFESIIFQKYSLKISRRFEHYLRRYMI